MQPSSENKLILIVRRTRLDDLISRFNTLEQARFYVEHLGADFSDYLQEHQTYLQTLAVAQATLARLEARVSLEEIMRVIPDYEIDASGLVRVHSTSVRITAPDDLCAPPGT